MWKLSERRLAAKLTGKAAELRKGLSPLEMQQVTMLLLCEVAKAEDDNPVGMSGEECIDNIARIAKQSYARIIKYPH
jgi:hypothetical protein